MIIGFLQITRQLHTEKASGLVLTGESKLLRD